MSLEATFAHSMKLTREAQGLSQAKLADRCRRLGRPKMQQQTVAKIEDGTQRLPLQDAGVIAWALGTPLLDLCGLPVQTSLSDDELRRLAREYEDQLRVLAGTVTLLEGGLVRETENLEDARAQLAKATARMRETERCLP